MSTSFVRVMLVLHVIKKKKYIYIYIYIYSIITQQLRNHFTSLTLKCFKMTIRFEAKTPNSELRPSYVLVKVKYFYSLNVLFLAVEQPWQACEFMSCRSKESKFMFAEMIYKGTVIVLMLVCSLYRRTIRLPLSSSVLATASVATQSSDILGHNSGLWSRLWFMDIPSVPAASYLG